MGSAYNSAQTIQGEGGDFNIVNTYLLNVYDEASFKGDVNFEGDVKFEGDVEFLGVVSFRNNVGFFEATYFSSSINVGGPASNPGIIKTPEVELVRYQVTIEPDGSSTQGWVPYDPPILLSELFDDVDDLEVKVKDLEDLIEDLENDIATNASNITTNASGIAANAAAIAAIDTSGGNTSFLALEARTATLENLVAAFNNNNNTDTPIENRITNLEAKINALISVYQSVKAIHNMPINLS